MTPIPRTCSFNAADWEEYGKPDGHATRFSASGVPRWVIGVPRSATGVLRWATSVREIGLRYKYYGTAHLRNTVIPIDYSIFVPPSLDLFIHLCGLTKYLRLFVPELL